MLTASDIQSADKAPIQHFTMESGERCASVFLHIGAHGFPDAVVLMRSPDGPMEVQQYNAGYELDMPRSTAYSNFDECLAARDLAMRSWVSDTLNKLATCHDGTVATYTVGLDDFLFA